MKDELLFVAELQKENQVKAYIISVIGVVFFLALMLVDAMRWMNGLLVWNSTYFYLMLTHLVLSFNIVPLLNLRFRFLKWSKKEFTCEINAILSIMAIVLSLVPMSLLSYIEGGGLLSFAVFICMLNLVFEIRPISKFYMNVGIMAFMAVCFVIISPSYLDVIINLASMMGVIFPTYLMSRFQYRLHRKSFENELLLKEQNKLLEKQNEIIAEKNEELRMFAYTASHDLKAPLRAVSGYVGLMKRRMKHQLDDRTKEYMDFVTDGVSGMNQMLTDLLDYATLDDSTKVAKDVDMNDILLRVLNNLSSKMSESNASIEVAGVLPYVHAPEVHMLQLFQNLVSNGIKFCRPGEMPKVVVESIEFDGKTIISVADNGIGIPEDQFDRVFGIFNRLHSKTKYEGHGIGLATCKKIVDKLGGRIWVESFYGAGSTFYVELPEAKDKTLSPETWMFSPPVLKAG